MSEYSCSGRAHPTFNGPSAGLSDLAVGAPSTVSFDHRWQPARDRLEIDVRTVDVDCLSFDEPEHFARVSTSVHGKERRGQGFKVVEQVEIAAAKHRGVKRAG